MPRPFHAVTVVRAIVIAYKTLAMAEPVAIVVLIAAAHGASPATSAMIVSAEETLGAHVALHAVEEMPADDDAALLGDMLGSDAVVEITWPEQKFGRARIRLYARRRAMWIEREVTFAPGDAEVERGRTVGYAFAAMIPEAIATSEADVVVEPAARPIVVAPPRKAAPALVRDVVTEPRPPRFTLEVRGNGLYGGAATLLGAGLAGRWLAASPWSLGAGIDLRRGLLGPVVLSSVRISIGAAARVSLGPRVDVALGLDLAAEYLSSRLGDATATRWIPLAIVAPELSWFALDSLALVLAPYAEVAAGPAVVTIGGAEIGRLPAVRIGLTAGVRWRL